MPDKVATEAEADLKLELYKSLRGEITGYVEKVPALWLQKFVLVGSVIAFLVSSEGTFAGRGELLMLAIVTIPVLAVLLDAKIAEYGLHARLASTFIAQNFADSPLVKDWEATLWGDFDDEKIRSLARLRSLMTVAVTVTPTIVLILLTGLAVDQLSGVIDHRFFYSALGVSVPYILAAIYMWYRVWPPIGARRKNSHK